MNITPEPLVTIRKGNSSDAVLLAEMGERAFRQAFAAFNTVENMQAYLSASFSPAIQSAELAQAGSLFLIAEFEGKPAGYARLLDGSTEMGVSAAHPVELVRFYALQEWIGKGLGARLMQACIDAAKDLGGDVLWLGVWEKNARAIAFYKKSGFFEVGKHPFYLGSDRQMDWIMVKLLS